ncbi:hypothetical protein [Pseudonocardia sp. GCM10023141]|uniref:hypothetical protein n=1 Tax=Pseudonocardia sp. GCM10023141 TaxID=3252653 RepID=UPI0036242AB6
MPTYRSVLRNGEFRAVLGAHVATMLAIITSDVSLAVLVFQRTQSPLLAAVTFAIGFVPMGVGAVFLAGVGRRRPSRDVLVACSAAVACLVAVMAVPGLPVPLVLGLLAVKGLIDPIFSGVRAATLPELLGDDGFAIGRSLLRLVSQNAQFAGFAAGGVALVFVTPSQALAAAACGHALAATVLLLGTRRRRPVATAAAARGPIAGIRALLAVPGIRPLMAMFWLPGFFAVAPEALAVPYAQVLGGGSVAVGLLLTGLPAGAVLGELLTGSLMRPAQRVRWLVPVAVAGFVPVLGYAFAPPLAVTITLLVVAGAGMSYLIGLDQLAVAAIDEDARRQAFTVLTAGNMVTQGLGFAAAGALAEWLPVPAAVPLLAATGLTVTLLAGRHLRRTHPLPVENDVAMIIEPC